MIELRVGSQDLARGSAVLKDADVGRVCFEVVYGLAALFFTAVRDVVQVDMRSTK